MPDLTTACECGEDIWCSVCVACEGHCWGTRGDEACQEIQRLQEENKELHLDTRVNDMGMEIARLRHENANARQAASSWEENYEALEKTIENYEATVREAAEHLEVCLSVDAGRDVALMLLRSLLEKP